jgi:decaprenylphospho-beta-D-ribofuranose 2-oxidase
MKISGWGCYPIIDSSNVFLTSKTIWDTQFITQGNSRSYGDASLSENIYSSLQNNRLVDFDETTGLLTCESGVLLSEIIDIFLPLGWFMLITPGTKLITVGGAVSSDVHGKNHHMEGCFSSCVKSFELLLPGDQTVRCSLIENRDLFHATCGGMGLTGVITKVSFYLKKVESQWIEQTTIKTLNLSETFSTFEKYRNNTYSVAWIDCLAKGSDIGRSLVMVGEFAKDQDLDFKARSKVTVPFNLPGFILNSWSVKAFNAIYYTNNKFDLSEQKINVDNFFYPLDAVKHWNRIYGKNGFVQFQFILPKVNSFNGLSEILERIGQSGMGSFLAVLKLYGPQNDNWLSFPLEGYSLALDFKMQKGLFSLIDELTDRVIELGGRIYLAKDALLTQKQFDASYPKANQFRQLRKEIGLEANFQSLLSRRLSL